MGILTNNEVRQAIAQDGDFPADECERLSVLATSYIKQKTGYDFSQDVEIEPLAKELARLYIRQEYYGAEGYNKDHDYSIGIASLIVDLQDIAKGKQQ